jgi:hypothetical protein
MTREEMALRGFAREAAAAAPPGRSVALLPERVRQAPEASAAGRCRCPTIDRVVVLRSAAGDALRPRFRYGHNLRVGSLAGVAGAAAGAATLFTGADPPTRRLLLS